MKAILTSTSDRNIEVNYRLPNGQVVMKMVPAYALNQEFDFPDEATYEVFKANADLYFRGDKPVFIEGKSSGSKAERIFTDREKGRAKTIKASADAAVDQIASATQDSGVKLDIEVASTGGNE